jgi:hypothetical protein
MWKPKRRLRGASGYFLVATKLQLAFKICQVITAGGSFGEQTRKLPGEAGHALGTREAKDRHEVRQCCLGMLPGDVRERGPRGTPATSAG